MKNYIFSELKEKTCPGDIHFTTGVLIKSDIDTLWDAVSKAENVKKYFTTDARRDLDTEGEVLWIWGEEAALIKVIHVVVRKKIIFEWNAMHVDYRTRVEFSFEEKNDRIKVKIKESGWEMNEAGIKSAFANCSGWTEFLNALKVYIENGIAFLK